jgi:hypothetical protein
MTMQSMPNCAAVQTCVLDAVMLSQLLVVSRRARRALVAAQGIHRICKPIVRSF